MVKHCNTDTKNTSSSPVRTYDLLCLTLAYKKKTKTKTNIKIN